MRQQADQVRAERRQSKRDNFRKMVLRGKRVKTNQAEAEARRGR